MFPAFSISLRADVLVTRGATLFGHIEVIDPREVVFAVGCKHTALRKVDIREVSDLLFDKRCNNEVLALPSAGLQPPCGVARRSMLDVAFQSGEHLLADSIQVRQTRVVIDMNTRGSLSGPRAALASVVRRDVCPSILEEEAPMFPAAFCLEQFRPVVNFGPGAVFNNTVFTKGIAVRVEVNPRVSADARGQVTEQVRGALQSALTLWTATLQSHRTTLPGPLAGMAGFGDVAWGSGYAADASSSR
jgi:hypothetical protein